MRHKFFKKKSDWYTVSYKHHDRYLNVRFNNEFNSSYVSDLLLEEGWKIVKWKGKKVPKDKYFGY